MANSRKPKSMMRLSTLRYHTGATPSQNNHKDEHNSVSHTERDSHADDHEKPILITNDRWLWCRDERARVWLTTERLPWWFFASFMNYCADVLDVTHDESGNLYDTVGADEKHLLTSLKEYPLSSESLIHEMRCYLAKSTIEGKISQGLINLDNANDHVIEQAQRLLLNVVFTTEEREAHKAADRAAALRKPKKPKKPESTWSQQQSNKKDSETLASQQPVLKEAPGDGAPAR
ncbi:hypothetical protein E4T49_04879 [Aureobasidium sp. EXF-10728]|nr:hypothetical protein E4T49_04879 [Aureobasidium sp. EXF-10728]